MSKVNKTDFHWMLQIQLPLLLTGLSCCYNVKTISVQLTHSGWWFCRYLPSYTNSPKYCETWRMPNPGEKQQWLLEIENHFLLWKWFGIINLLWWLPERKNKFDWSFLHKRKQKIPKWEKQRGKNTDWKGSHEKFVFTYGTSPNSAQENLLPKDLKLKNQARWFQKVDANTLLKTQTKKSELSEFFRVVNTPGQKKHICMFITVSDLCIFAEKQMKVRVC